MRLIDADALKTELDAWARIFQKPNHYAREDALYIIDCAPTIDAVPVVRGEWVKSDDYKGWLVCSACHDCYVDNAWVNGKKWRYCPNCGAKMEVEP